MNSSELTEMVKNARKEQSLFSTLDILELARSFDNEGHVYLEDKSLKSIAEDIFHKLHEIDYLQEEDRPMYCEKLKDYFLIKNMNELRKSHYVRYMKKGDPKLYNGGILMSVSNVKDNIYHIGLRMFGNRFITINYDNYIFFQKLTPDEKIILLSFDYIEQFNEDNEENERKKTGRT